MAIKNKSKGKKRIPLIDDYHLLSYEQIDSTNMEARRLAEGGGAHGAFIWALQQTDGRGRGSKSWVSQNGNLFTSALLAPDCDFALYPQLSFVAAAAAHASIAPLLPQAKLQLKWPNDVMLDGKKLAGLLLESFEITNDFGIKKRWAVIGLGMNIEHSPTQVDNPATSLKQAGVELISAKIVLSRFIHHFTQWYELWQDEGFAPVRKYWMNYAMHKGTEMEVRVGNDFHQGTFVGLDKNGNLELKTKHGKIALSAGEVIL